MGDAKKEQESMIKTGAQGRTLGDGIADAAFIGGGVYLAGKGMKCAYKIGCKVVDKFFNLFDKSIDAGKDIDLSLKEARCKITSPTERQTCHSEGDDVI